MRLLRIESLDDPRVADYRNVRDSDLRARGGVFLAEGRLNVKRLIAAERHKLRSVFVTETGLRSLRDRLESLGDDTAIYVAPQAVMNDVVGYDMHRGCLAAAERSAEVALGDLIEAASEPPALWIVLEDLTNPDNMGGVFRNALAFGAAAAVLTARCVDPLYRKALRVSMGASLRVPYTRVSDAPGALSRLGEAGFLRIALTTDRDAVPLERCRVPDRVALLLGNEGSGSSPAALARADLRVTIPMAPGADSLNVATASGIALHHFRPPGGPAGP